MMTKSQMERVMIGSFHNTAAVRVLKDGEQVYENFFQGYTASDTIHVASVTKSVLSGLYGIAVNQGKLDIEQKVMDFFPEYQIPQNEKTLQQIRIKDMLTMTAPYKCKTEPYMKMFTGKEWVNMGLGILGGNGRIGEFVYSPLLGVQVLSGILTKAINQPILGYAGEQLFQPLGITVKDSLSFYSKEENLEFLNARNISGWATDPEGNNTAGWGLTLTISDMAKIGQLYLNGGRWQDEQLIPEAWIKDSTGAHSKCSRWKLSYGYLWWVIDEKENSYAAMGDGGNIIYVNNKRKLVVAMLCSYMPQAKDRLQLIKNYIEPLFT